MMRYSQDLAALQEQMNRLLEPDSARAAHLWTPAVDVWETPSEIVLHAELPGMSRDDIAIQLSGGTLTLRGERKMAAAKDGENFHRIERQYGLWQRTFQIEAAIDASAVAASYEHGVLTVTLPKKTAVKPHRIEIQVK